MVKHCNPIGTNLSFPLAATQDTLLLDAAKNNNPTIRVHMFGLGVNMSRTGAAASRIWSTEGLDVGNFESKLDEYCNRLSRYNEQYIISLLTQTTGASQTLDDASASSGCSQ